MDKDTLNDKKKESLEAATGEFGQMADLELIYLQALTLDTTGDIADQWMILLDNELIPDGDLSDRLYIYFGRVSVRNSYNARSFDYWSDVLANNTP